MNAGAPETHDWLVMYSERFRKVYITEVIENCIKINYFGSIWFRLKCTISWLNDWCFTTICSISAISCHGLNDVNKIQYNI